MKNDDTDRAIAAYRVELAAKAELADRDLDEIEDHLRSLTDDLRATGMPAAAAVSEAARRLGEPRRVAREHARVRTAFGTRLSRARAWSIVVLIVPVFAWNMIELLPYTGLWSRYILESAASITLALAVAAGLSWARAALLGGMGFVVGVGALVQLTFPEANPAWIVWQLGVFAFLAPWRPRELTGAGWAVALAVFSYGAASFALGYQINTDDGTTVLVAPVAIAACVSAALSAAGAILRARWSAVSFGVTAILLGSTAFELVGMTPQFADPDIMNIGMATLLASGICASLLGAVYAWRSARSLLGNLRSIAA